MSKLNVAAFQRKPKVYFENDFPVSVPGAPPLSFRFQKNDALSSFKIRDVERELVQKYVEEGFPFPPYGIGSEEVEVTESMIQAVAPILVLQRQTDPYTFEELVWIAATEEDAWEAIVAFFWKSHIQAKDVPEAEAGKSLGEPSGAPTPKD